MKKDNKTGSDKIKEMVSEKLIEGLQKAIDKGIGSWQMPWSGGNSFPKNFKSGKRYRGVNILMLGLQGYESPTWLTFNQAKEAGGKVKKGEKSTPVIYWSWLYKDEAGKTVKDRKLAAKKIPMLRYFQVFNIAQCEGIKDKWQPTPDKEHNPIKEAELIVENMPNAPEITFKEAKAYYRPATDSVNMPRLGLFRSAEEYYSTLFHELIHSTGHKSRLDREGITEFAGFGSETYSKEELVAEMGAAMLCAITGVKNEAMEKNQVSYLRGWIKALKDDINLAVSAGGQAQKAVDYIEGTEWED